MSGFSELIKNFEKTRDYVRDFFICGFKTRGDFDRKSARTYDDEKRRIESWLGDFLRYEDGPRGRSISISVDSGRITENPLYNAFYAKSFTDNDIKLHFFLLDILVDCEESLTLKEIIEKTDERFGVLFEEQTVRNKLKEYVSEGLILAEKRGKTACFSLSPDRVFDYLKKFSGLTDAVKFFSEAGPFGIVGNSILKAAGLENDLFCIKHNYIVHTLEDVLMPEILRAVEEKRFLAMRTFSSKNGFRENENFAVPMQISISAQTGRRYLIAYVPEYKRFNSFRLDQLRTVKAMGVFKDYDELHEKYLKNIKHCFGASFGERRTDGNIEPLKITFFADETNEDYIIQRIEREKRCGTLERVSENLFELTLDVFDPVEPMHWLKTFIGRIVKLEGGSKAARRLFYSDIKRMNRYYNGENDEHFQ